ncbi:hypothetical protein JV173_05440 [Acholeplasma equirhinis]|uniref:hypothetical protein n=1 Tax=Acholeplasma equirhinis TaxID=555393 RepID=UPI00197AD160|nr:hypothetical protein [Acholeplasma equirhinis]MBN3490958.1 hypothetical protein [Acholeplasma equirhinis]
MLQTNYIKGFLKSIQNSHEYILNDKIHLEKFMLDIIEQEINHIKRRYELGFFHATSLKELYTCNILLESFKTSFLMYFEEGITLNRYLDILRKKSLFLYQNETIYRPFLDRILSKFEAKMLTFKLDFKGNVLVKIEEPNLYIILEIKDKINGIVFEEFPKNRLLYQQIFSLVPFVITKEQLEFNRFYILNLATNECVKDLKNELKYAGSTIQSLTQLGVEVFDLEVLSLMQNSKLDFIFVEPEKAYLKNDGLLDYVERIQFYKSLYRIYKDSEILITLPRLDILIYYHRLDDDFIVDQETLSRFYTMYIEELRAIFSHPHNHLKITIPHSASEYHFEKLRQIIMTIIKENYQTEVPIGFNIEHDLGYENLELFKHSDFTIIDTERLYGEIVDEKTKEDTFLTELMEVKEKTEIKHVEMYLTGTTIQEKKYYSKILELGFKYIVVNFRLFEYYSVDIQNDLEIIQNFDVN